MDDNIEKIDVDIDLADAELISYFHDIQQGDLTVKIQAWNSQIITFVFFDRLLFIDRGGNFITSFCKSNLKTHLFMESLEKAYGNIPKEHPYKLFQFLDVDDNPYLEIICENFKSTIS